MFSSLAWLLVAGTAFGAPEPLKMRVLPATPALVPLPTRVEGEGQRCGETALKALFEAQAIRLKTKNAYGDRLSDIGYLPEQFPCGQNWDYSIRLSDDGKSFIATSIHRSTGETWSVNQDKEIKKER